MKKKNKNILFQLVIYSPDPKQEKKYTIFDKKPCFSNLTDIEKKAFLKTEIQKIKTLINKEYKSRFQKNSTKASPAMANNGA
jgi:hypothetical protein